MIKINEFFYSIQGESSYAGQPTVFVRTTGCHLRCHYCDSKYSYFEGDYLTIDQIVLKIKAYGNPNGFVCVTGGEPLLQPPVFDLVKTLCDLNYKVSVETSGAKSVLNLDPRALAVVDIKTPDSGAADTFLLENLKATNLELKFVICSKADFDWAISFCRQHLIFDKFTVLLSPAWGLIEPFWLAEQILEKKISARLQLQQHKYIWNAEQRGV